MTHSYDALFVTLSVIVAILASFAALELAGTDDDILRRGVFHGETAFLQKPFTPEQVARKVRGVLDRS
jgi:hypothetical protein